MWVEKRADDNYKFIERYKDPLTGNLRKVSIFFENAVCKIKLEK